ncbi:uncharacterized protein PFL1_00429 [Pseudozyma flocculosa PF-1]|uniref:Oxidoreductase-like domain-containing protein n=1 Tax=Pseudozyma flocculosa TaxID=84751 RepID=A0A5C3ESI2_9BASI|nr:uncharacterized protein PFL1_00429 [Pseudozyma flocculosa PF-1]EPQ32232.1 hypothetical protein PFL1_00429 [Pseudozyma flocculosa PF-1]SPO34820.1 uncharacterized protein PSFLO_00291 [Pseudozyma flocculosa]
MTDPDLAASPQPAFADPAEVPSILAQRKLTNTRKKQLIKAASRPHNDPPPPPAPSDCCGSSCDPCVKTLWKEEKLAWSQRWGPHAIDPAHKQSEKANSKVEEAKSMPGAFDW